MEALKFILLLVLFSQIVYIAYLEFRKRAIKKALKNRSAIARKIEMEIADRYGKSALSNNDLELETLGVFYSRGLTDGCDFANSIMDKFFRGEAVTREELKDAIRDVCRDDPF